MMICLEIYINIDKYFAFYIDISKLQFVFVFLFNTHTHTHTMREREGRKRGSVALNVDLF